MPTGVVKRWNGDRGFGFVTPDDGSEELFVHMKALQDGNDYLTEGEAVEYEAEWNEQKGKMECSACSGGYNGGEWVNPNKGKGKGDFGGGYGKAMGGKGWAFSPYGKGKDWGKGGGGGGGVCNNFQRTGECKFGDTCKFSHA